MKLHFVENQDIQLVYFPETLNFFKIDNYTKNLIQSINSGIECNKICKEFCININSYNLWWTPLSRPFFKKIKKYSILVKVGYYYNNCHNWCVYLIRFSSN
jgi:hypothetical protein